LTSQVGESIWNELGLVVIGFFLIQIIYGAIVFHSIDAESLLQIPHFYRPKGEYRAELVVIILKVLVVSAPGGYWERH
jgi:xanthine/uracil permease